MKHAKSYSAGCKLASCDTGWKPSRDKKKCVANVCSCANGQALSGVKCLRDGANLCGSCKTGFKLSKSQCVQCGTSHATAYSSGCKASACSAGYKVVKGACAGCVKMNDGNNMGWLHVYVLIREAVRVRVVISICVLTFMFMRMWVGKYIFA